MDLYRDTPPLCIQGKLTVTGVYKRTSVPYTEKRSVPYTGKTVMSDVYREKLNHVSKQRHDHTLIQISNTWSIQGNLEDGLIQGKL